MTASRHTCPRCRLILVGRAYHLTERECIDTLRSRLMLAQTKITALEKTANNHKAAAERAKERFKLLNTDALRKRIVALEHDRDEMWAELKTAASKLRMIQDGHVHTSAD